MYLSRLKLNRNAITLKWVSNPYRVHQRLCMACEGDPRILFRLEQDENLFQILVQSHIMPDWDTAFADLHVLSASPETKRYEPILISGGLYRFRLLGNPTVKRDGKRMGLLREEDQEKWLTRKLQAGGMELVECLIREKGFQRSWKDADTGKLMPVHFLVLFEGVLRVLAPDVAQMTLEKGIGSGKGFGCGLLSLARLG